MTSLLLEGKDDEPTAGRYRWRAYRWTVQMTSQHHWKVQMANLPLEGTDDEPWLAEEEECVEVAEEDPAQQDVAQLPPCAHKTIFNTARQLGF